MDYANLAQVHLTQFVESFVVSRAKARYLQLAGTPGGREKFERTLDRITPFVDANKGVPPRAIADTEDELLEYLIRRGGVNANSEVLVFGIGGRLRHGSRGPDIDVLSEVIPYIYGGYSGLISILPGRLVYYGHEDVSKRWILEEK